jgi:hypothetical protein
MNHASEIRNSEDLTFREFLSILLNNKVLIGTITSSVALASILFSLTIPNTYISSSLLAGTTQEDSLTAKLGNLSSLGSFAGLSLPSNPTSKSQEGIVRIKSFEFFSTYFLPNIKLENIMAVNEWEAEKNILIYDADSFDSNTKQWVRDVKYPKKTEPSPQEAYKEYKDILVISEDKVTSFITISIEHKSPFIAQKWVGIITNKINESMRLIDSQQAEKSIAYLNRTSQSTNFQSLKVAIASLLQDQMQTLMLTSSNESYVFKIIDPPLAPEEKSKPSRVLIGILGTILGSLLSLLVIFIKYHREPFDT